MESRETKALVISGGFGALLFVVNFVFGATITYLTAFPGGSIIFTAFFIPFIFTIASLMTGRFGTVTIIFGIYSLLSIPTVLMGPPGFYKAPVGILVGLSFDVILSLFKRKMFAFYIAQIGYSASLMLFLFGAMKLLNLPGVEKVQKALIPGMAVVLILGVFGIAVGSIFFKKKLMNLSKVKQLME